MALEITGGGISGSNLVAGAGTNSATFTMPNNVALSVESVVATVDNSAGGDTTAQITISDQSGVVIATKRQEDVIPAGDTGTTTFALRVVDNGGQIRYRRTNTGAWLYVLATGHGGPYNQGIVLQTTGGRITLLSSNNPVEIDAPTDTIFLSGVDLQGVFDNAVSLTASSSMLLNCRANVLDLSLAGGGTKVRVKDQTGNAIFEVRSDGSLHGKTGQALTFDL